MKKIFFIFENFHEFHLKNLDIEKLQLYFSIEIICYNNTVLKNIKNENLNIHYVKKDIDVLILLEGISEKSFVFFAINNLSHKKLFDSIRKLNLIKCSIHHTSFMPARERNYLYDFYNKVFVERNLILSFIRFFNKFFLKKQKPFYDIVFTAGELSYKINNSIGLKNISTISRDFNISKEFKKKIVEENLIVYLDCGVGSHPDEVLSSWRYQNLSQIKIKKFYEELNTFFLDIEKKQNTKVIIATHPRRSFFDHKAFKNRIIKNSKTVDLVARSKCVISTHSTSMQYAVIFKKPIILITSKNLPFFSMYSDIHKWKKHLECKLINISKNYDLEFNLNYKGFDRLYDRFFQRYVCNMDKKNYPKSIWEDFISEYK
jgi:hypothetical protein